MIVRGTVAVPGDKSISHRALLLSALADGASRIDGLLDSADVRSTADVLRALGVAVPGLGGAVTVDGVGLRGLAAPGAALDCGNSGTTTRLVAGLVAAHPFSARFVGDASLSLRPMRRVAAPLAAMGAQVEVDGHGGLPMTVRGGELQSVEWESPVASAQVKSAVLLAALCAGVRAVVREPARSRDHTERMLAARGAWVGVSDDAVMLMPADRISALDVRVPGDPSSAAFFAGLAALADHGELVMPDVCANPTRTAFLDVLARMGARIERLDERVEGGEPVCTLRVAPGGLRGVSVSAAEVPAMIDEIPMLAVLAARADGETRVTGAAELRVKESDRIAAVVANLRAIGVDADELPDGLVVRGTRAPVAGRIVTHGDHRLAMAFAVLGASRGATIDVDDAACVGVSFPGFWETLEAAAAR